MKLPFLSVCALTLLFPICLSAEEPVSQEQLPKQLVGTWKLVSATYDGSESDLPKLAAVIPISKTPQEAPENHRHMRTHVPRDVWWNFEEEGSQDPAVPMHADGSKIG